MTQEQNELFGAATVVDVTLPDMLAEVERELLLRALVYPRWVHAGQMTQADSDRQMLIMRAVRVQLEILCLEERR